MAWQKLDTKTLGAAGDTVTTSIFTSKKFNHYFSHLLQVTGLIREQIRLGKTTVDTGTNYANRISNNGGADSTNVSQDRAYVAANGISGDIFEVGFMINISDQEKLGMCWNVNRNTAGSGTAPERNEAVFKWINTANQFDIMETLNDQAGDFNTDSNLSLLGTD